MTRATCLLVLLLPVLAACGSNSSRREEIKRAPMRELFPPVVAGQPSADAATAPATQPPAPPQVPANQTPPDNTRWPVSFAAEGVTFQVYEPVLDAVRDDQLTVHSLVLAQPAGQKQAVPGSVLMTAKAQADRGAGLVVLRDVQVTDARFQAEAMTHAGASLLRKALPENVRTVQLSRLESGMSIVQAHERSASATNVAVPRVIIAQQPAVLVYIDGEPRYVPLRSGTWMGVVNTRELLLKNPSGTHYLHLYNGWVSAASLQGPWVIASPPPGAAKLEQAARATGRANLLVGKPDEKGRAPSLSKSNLPQIIVSTIPAALIVVDGAPTFARVAGTSLQYATNTSAHLFRDLDTKSLYVRAGGYWFRAGAVAGPWVYVPAAKLPAAFSAIPDDSPKRSVKTAIATANGPASATIVAAPAVVSADRKSARLSITMDGDPVLQPIAGTQLNFVANASLPIVQVDINNWYACQNGVWFHSSRATGPWTVTDSVPSDIYVIPPTAPLYSAIHSRVIASSTDVIYYGYPAPGSLPGAIGGLGVEDQGADYEYTPPSGLHWGWFY
jgi:hypothetical protein